MTTMTTMTMILTIKLTHTTQTIKLHQWLNIDPKYLENGMLFALDKDLFIAELDNHINGQLGFSLATLSLLCTFHLISIYILYMEQDSNIAESSSTQVHNTETDNNKGRKPTIDIVYSRVVLGQNMYFVYDRNSSPGDDSFISLLSIKKDKLNKAEMEINGKLHSGILRYTMVPSGNGGFKLMVKPTVYRRLVETHNLESNGRNLIYRAGNVVIFKDD